MAEAGHRTGSWRSLRDLPDRTPLRVKLIAAVLVLVAIALTVISLVGIYVLRANLLGSVDNTVAQLHFQTERGVNGPGLTLGGRPAVGVGEAVIWVPNHGSASYLEIPVTASGYAPGTNGQKLIGPSLSPSQASSLPTNPLTPVTVGSATGDRRWRVVGIPSTATAPNGAVTHGTIVVAVDATSAYRTIGALTLIDFVVSLVIVLALALVGAGVVRASLKPLTEIEQTAGAIAAGDLGRRVPERDPRTEVGRLGRSLNVMLSQIEAAFRAQSRSEAAARRSEEKMRQFVADASHELRTPLTAIRGFAEYYRQRGGMEAGATGGRSVTAGRQPEAGNEQETGTAHENGAAPGTAEDVTASRNGTGQLASADLDRIMRRVEQESSRMGVLVDDMLLLARVDQQRPLDRRPVDLLTLAADAVHDARVVAPDRSINLTVGSGAALLVIGDDVRLRQVIGNLMSNALSHTPDGTPIDVLIRSGNLDEAPPASGDDQAVPADQPVRPQPQPAAVLEVADHGPGLTREQAGHVFERFYRADQARTAGRASLGLAIVAALVTAHGGAAWVRSRPGNGATFCIALPLSPEAAQGADEDDDPGEEAGTTDPATAEPWATGPNADAPTPPRDDPGSAQIPGAAAIADGWIA